MKARRLACLDQIRKRRAHVPQRFYFNFIWSKFNCLADIILTGFEAEVPHGTLLAVKQFLC